MYQLLKNINLIHMTMGIHIVLFVKKWLERDFDFTLLTVIILCWYILGMEGRKDKNDFYK